MSLIRADARRIPLVDGCVQCVVTSPPYWGLRDYGAKPSVWGGDDDCDHEWTSFLRAGKSGGLEKSVQYTVNQTFQQQQQQQCRKCAAWVGCFGLEPTPELYVSNLTTIFAEVWRVLKDDGTCWLNLGDSYANDGKFGGETGGKQAYLPDSDRKRVGREKRITGLKPKDLVGIPWRVAFALQSAGWYLRSDIIWSKPNPMPESVTDRPTKAHEYIFLLTKQERYYFNAAAIQEPVSGGAWVDEERRRVTGRGAGKEAEKHPSGRQPQRSNSGGFPVRKNEQSGDRRKVGFNDRWDAKEAQRKAEAAGVNGRNVQAVNSEAERRDQPGTFNNNPNMRPNLTRNKRTVWHVATQPYIGSHFATFPEALIEPCILAGSRPGDLVYDPFIGSGTTGVVCDRLMRRWVGTDLSYQHLSKTRTAQRGLRLELDGESA